MPLYMLSIDYKKISTKECCLLTAAYDIYPTKYTAL